MKVRNLRWISGRHNVAQQGIATTGPGDVAYLLGGPVTAPSGSSVEEALDKGTAPSREAWRRFMRNRVALVSAGILLAACILALAAPLLGHYGPTTIDLTGTLDQPPSSTHWLGTDGLGRDTFTRLLYGMRIPLSVAAVGTVLCVLIGALTGLAAGLLGGWVDAILMRITEFIFAVPGILLIVLCIALFGRALDSYFGVIGRLTMITIFIATDSWPPLMRLARGEALHLRSTAFIDAATVAGASTRQILLRHLLPNIAGIMAVQACLMLPGFLFVTGALSLIGLGLDPQVPDLGAMLVAGSDRIGLNDVEMIAPSAVYGVLTVAATFLGDGLRDAVDPRQSR